MYRKAISVARKAGRILKKRFGEPVHVGYKKGREQVTDADKEIEKFIMDRLMDHFPDDGFLGEEGDSLPGKSFWIVDPIDGTSNFIMGVPFFSVSIAHFNGNELDFGVVYNPVSGKIYHAESGKGAFMNGRKISVSETSSLKDARLCHCYTGGRKYREEAGRMVAALYPRVADLRRLGSASLELGLVAEGMIDGFFQTGVRIWDVAAGVILVKEAGGKAEDLNGREFAIRSRGLWAHNGKLRLPRQAFR